jgi:cation diffusion facilitator family transporter
MRMPGPPYRLPPEKQAQMRKARRLEWWTIFLMLTVIAVVGLTMGASQTMKAAWTEDLLSLIPPTVFLIGSHFLSKPPDDQFPYGYRRAVMIACLCASVALFALGSYIFVDSLLKLVMAEHATIQTVNLFGHRVWLGWLMMAALVYSVIPPVVLGRMKLPLARALHEKALQTDAEINKADWQVGVAGILGLLGLGLGYWWADAVAAGIISFDIIKDGVKTLRNSVAQLMNKRPSDVESREQDPTPDKVQQALEELDWVAKARVRLREDGDVLTGEAFVVPRDESDLLDRLGQAAELVSSLDWRLADVNIVPVHSLE